MAQDGFIGKLLCYGMARAQSKTQCRGCCNPESEIPPVCGPAGVLLHLQEGRGHKQMESSMSPSPFYLSFLLQGKLEEVARELVGSQGNSSCGFSSPAIITQTP